MTLQRSIGPQLTDADGARMKGMLLRKDRQSDIAQYHSCNQGRVIEAKKGIKFAHVAPMPPDQLPPPGPYTVVTRLSHERGLMAERVVRELREALGAIVARVEHELDRLEEGQSGKRHTD